MGSNEKQLALGIGGALVLGLGVIWVVPQLAEPPQSPVIEAAPIAVAASVATPEPAVDPAPELEVAPVIVEPEPEPEPEPEKIPEVEPALEPEVAPEDVVEAAPEPEPAPIAPLEAKPSFDTFQLGKDGEALIAGRAKPDAFVDVVLAGQVVVSAQTDSNGAFVAFVTVAPSEQPRGMHLVSDPDGAAIRSEETIIVSPFATEVAVAEVEVEPVPDVAPLIEAETEVIAEVAENVVVEEVTAEAEQVSDSEAVENTTQDIETVATAIVETTQIAEPEIEIADPIAPTVNELTATVAPEVLATAPPVLVSDADGVRVLQPSDVAPDVLSNVALDAITYDPSGEVLLSGRASGDGFVQVYIDNQPVTTSRITVDGDWRTDLPEVDTGIYTLRIDEVDAEGTVVSRVETPFKREEPEAVAAVMAEETAQEDFEVAVRTVQQGSTLWAIAREQFGEGTMFVEVFEANRDLIRDPDLIFPGQVLRIPQMPIEAGQ